VVILEGFDFEVVRIRGSHHHMQRIIEGASQNLNVPVHGKKPLALGTLASIYRQACLYVEEEELKPHFYVD
jgi:predicted RNA binding protein YcfA (HicA-like mRNA interferase family)